MSDITTTGNGLLSFIERASRDETFSIEKFEALLRMRRDEEQDQARKMFNRAMAEVEAEIGPIIRDRVNPAVNRKYATLEAISAVLRPVYSKHGFAVRFGCDKPPKEGWMRITCTTSHAGGYSEQIYLDSPVDVQQGGRGRTPVQAVGSTITYLRRYLLQLAFNVVLADDEDDDDGEVMRRAAAAATPRPVRIAEQAKEATRTPREQINAEVPLAEEPPAPQPERRSWAQWADSLEIAVREAESNEALGRLLARAEVTEIYRLAKEGTASPAKERIVAAVQRAEERYLADPPDVPEDELPEIAGADKVLAG
jgi:hypothetical protein